MKTAVILAGGKGTRLAEVRADVPKPMMPVLGKPLLAYQIDLLKAHGFTTVWLIVNHMYEHIESYFSDGKDFGVDIKYYVEEKPLGTVGGVKAIEAQLKEPFLVLYGDVLMDMDLSRLVAFHHNKNADATLVVHPNDHPYDSDLLAVDNESRVTAFYAKPHPEGLRYRNLVNAAAYVFDPVVLEHLEPGVKADFGKDIFPTLHSKLNVFAYNTPEYLKDMGTPDRLEKVEEALKSGKVAARNLNNKQRCVFLDRDGVINIDTDLIDRPEDDPDAPSHYVQWLEKYNEFRTVQNSEVPDLRAVGEARRHCRQATHSLRGTCLSLLAHGVQHKPPESALHHYLEQE